MVIETFEIFSDIYTFPLGTFPWLPYRVGNGDCQMSITAHEPIARGILVLSN